VNPAVRARATAAVDAALLIVYHHADRTAAVEQQARRRLADLAREMPAEPIAAVRASHGTSRLFLVAAATPSHAQYLTGRLTALAASPWVTELVVYWSDLPRQEAKTKSWPADSTDSQNILSVLYPGSHRSRVLAP
jgi:hypothetical protein